jgi:hypothetical protein
MIRAALSGTRQNANAITALHAANPFLEVHNVAGPAKNRSPTSWTGRLKLELGNCLKSGVYRSLRKQIGEFELFRRKSEKTNGSGLM